MPGFDGTGPLGMGSMTGGGRGFCAIPLPRTRPAYGMPWGMPYYGASTAVGPFFPQMTQEHEAAFLKAQAQAMREQLAQVEGRIKELGGKNKS